MTPFHAAFLKAVKRNIADNSDACWYIPQEAYEVIEGLLPSQEYGYTTIAGHVIRPLITG